MTGTARIARSWPLAAGALAGLLNDRLLVQHQAGPHLQQGFALFSAAIAMGLLARAAY